MTDRPTHPLVLALLHITRQLSQARVRGRMREWPTPNEILSMADADVNTDLTMRPRRDDKGKRK